MEIILDTAIKLLAALILALGTYAIKRLVTLITTKVYATNDAELTKLVNDFVAAAEQELKEKDPDGIKRKAYVESLLTQAGYAVTDILKAKIESAVYAINKANE